MYSVLLMPENDNNWVGLGHVCLPFKGTDWVVSLDNIFCHFFSFPSNFYQRNGYTWSCACYKVYGVDKLSNTWNLYKKSIRIHLTLYLTRFSIAKHPIFKQKSWHLRTLWIRPDSGMMGFSIDVYNHARWSGITKCFLWIVYFNNGQ